jgi:alkanesulfonate monooxygenase SsuD/methylene tetrahydromethanopterin reductase-like flavin-dependent oxidoreductase (luciferase family)
MLIVVHVTWNWVMYSFGIQGGIQVSTTIQGLFIQTCDKILSTQPGGNPMDIAIDIEGQNGLNWAVWKQLVHGAEDLGFAALYRSDHFSSIRQPPDFDALELWVSLTWVACNTKRIEFGPLVSPISSITARMAANVDDLSGGRLQLGLGTGWAEREHDIWGFEFGDVKTRFERFEEGLELIYTLFHTEQPVTFSGKYFTIKEALLLPKPSKPGGPSIIVGGRGGKKTTLLAARFAAEWNTYRVPEETIRCLMTELDKALASINRDPATLRRSAMLNIILGKTDREVEQKSTGKTYAQWREVGVIGTPNEIVDQLGGYAALGLDRVMLQMNNPCDLDLLEAIGVSVLPQLE